METRFNNLTCTKSETLFTRLFVLRLAASQIVNEYTCLNENEKPEDLDFCEHSDDYEVEFYLKSFYECMFCKKKKNKALFKRRDRFTYHMTKKHLMKSGDAILTKLKRILMNCIFQKR